MITVRMVLAYEMPVRHTHQNLAKVTQKKEGYSVKFRQMYCPVIGYKGFFF